MKAHFPGISIGCWFHLHGGPCHVACLGRSSLRVWVNLTLWALEGDSAPLDLALAPGFIRTSQKTRCVVVLYVLQDARETFIHQIYEIMIIRQHFPLVTCLRLLPILLGALWFSDPITAKKDQPSISEYKFGVPPSAEVPPLYFEDSDSILVLDEANTVYLSKNLGGDDFKFVPVKDVPEGAAFNIFLHPHNNQVAIIWGRGAGTHYITEDRGENWREIAFDGFPIAFQPPFSFHASDPNKIIINVCMELIICNARAYYTTDLFKTSVKELDQSSRTCLWARSNELFDTGEDDEGDNRIICVVQGPYTNPWSKTDNRLTISDNFFEDEEEPILEADRMVRGIINIAPVKGFLVAAASAKGTKELALYASTDGKQWHRGVFPKDHKLEEDAYTVLESTNYSIQVDVMTTMSTNAMGVLFTSNSNGTYFTRNIEHTNRNYRGLVDFEKVQGIQGIVIVNVVDNWKKVEADPHTPKEIKSLISFDDGRNWNPLTADDEEIHLHSVTDISNTGRVFSSPAPGVVMAVGNRGKKLKSYKDGDLYVSDDAGMTWRLAQRGPHKYEFGDRGSLLMAIPDEDSTDKFSYSINHGKDWKEADLGKRVRAQVLTTTPDSTSLKFILFAYVGRGMDTEYTAYSINFEDLHEETCKDSDFEKWYARVDEKGEPTCIMGHKQWYRRRKPDADCFVDKEFEDPVPEYEPCACTKQDFECDYDFIPSEDKDKCMPAPGTKFSHVEGECAKEDDTYLGSSGFRQIPGNDCNRDDDKSVVLDKEVERPCSEKVKAPISGEISQEVTEFRAGGFEEYFYLERSDRSQEDDETIIMRTDEREVYITRDAGKTWEQKFKDEEITAIYPHQHFNDVAYFLTGGKKVYYTINRGKTFDSFEAPNVPTVDRRIPVLGFHPKYKDWLIWTGAVDCGSKKGDCHNVAYFSENRGADWPHELRFVGKCEFIKEEGGGGLDKLVYCEQYKDEVLTQSLQLKYSDNWFADSQKPFDDIIDFATMAEFIVVAARKTDEPEALTCHTSVDGKTFAHAQFPPSFEVPVQKAYTVLDSATHAVFLHVTVNDRQGYEYGSVIKSNSNGTSYVMSLPGVNRNENGYVDFEKMQGLEGVIMVNVVANIQEADEGQAKKLRSAITHNDGAQWTSMRAPEKDAEGRAYDCDTSDPAACSLHLHSYTERRDPRATFSSPSAIGLMMGVGNVGPFLGRKQEADTFITRDGGVEWYAVKKGSFMWEYGDQGSILCIVEDSVPTRSVYYSLDEGRTWKEYQFSETEFRVLSISTVPSDKSRNFILWGQDITTGSKVQTINLDFTGLTERKCELNENEPEAGDYYLWEPKHPMQEDNCLLGHIARYHRKRVEADCYNGESIQHRHSIAQNCSCTRQDFEW